MTKLLYITSLISLNEKRPENKSVQIYIDNFKKLLCLEIRVHVFISKCYINYLNSSLNNEEKNKVKITCIDLEDLLLYKKYSNCESNISLPKVRNIEKDTFNYLILMNSKIEFIKIAIDESQSDITHFAWIDIGICYILKDNENTLKQFNNFNSNNCSTLKEKFLIFPCCWTKEYSQYNITSITSITNIIQWRFCGGFFLGDKDSLLNMYDLQIESVDEFITKYGILVWEVNMWFWMENNKNWNIDYYIADHNDSIFNVPNYIFYEKRD